MRAEEIRKRRQAARDEFGQLFIQARLLFGRYDLMGIWSPQNPDEYDGEISTVLPRLRTAASAHDVERILREEFDHWFYPGCIKPPKSFKPFATDLWAAWLEHTRRGPETTPTVQ
jgi:hypothetical protein